METRSNRSHYSKIPIFRKIRIPSFSSISQGHETIKDFPNARKLKTRNNSNHQKLQNHKPRNTNNVGRKRDQIYKPRPAPVVPSHKYIHPQETSPSINPEATVQTFPIRPPIPTRLDQTIDKTLARRWGILQPHHFHRANKPNRNYVFGLM
jgi:hypothetical protein